MARKPARAWKLARVRTSPRHPANSREIGGTAAVNSGPDQIFWAIAGLFVGAMKGLFLGPSERAS